MKDAERFLRKIPTIPVTGETADMEQMEPSETAPETPKTPKKSTTKTDRSMKSLGIAKGQMSGLAAAAKVLQESDVPMNVRAITDAAIRQGYWSPGGKTPSATISSAIQRDIKKHGTASRFLKVSTGKFAASGVIQ